MLISAGADGNPGSISSLTKGVKMQANYFRICFTMPNVICVIVEDEAQLSTSSFPNSMQEGEVTRFILGIFEIAPQDQINFKERKKKQFIHNSRLFPLGNLLNLKKNCLITRRKL